MRLRNKLWKPDSEQIIPREKRKPPQDDICLTCPNYKDDYCKGLCPPLQWINGRGETKEYLPDNPIELNADMVDYNTKLYEMITDTETRDIERLEYIRSISNPRLKAIAACTLVWMKQDEIAKFAHISQGRISKLYRVVKR